MGSLVTTLGSAILGRITGVTRFPQQGVTKRETLRLPRRRYYKKRRLEETDIEAQLI